MKIESMKGPAAPTLMGQTYSFVRDGQGRFVADVIDEKAVACFVARDDHYRVLPDDPLPDVALVGTAPLAPLPQPTTPAGWPGLHWPNIGISGDVYETANVLLEIAGSCQLSVAAWNALPDVARERLFAATTAIARMVVHDPAVPFVPAAPTAANDTAPVQPIEGAGSGDSDGDGDGNDDYEPQDSDTAAKLSAAREAVETRKAALDGLPPDATAENRAANQLHYDAAVAALEALEASFAAPAEPAESSAASTAPKPKRPRKPKPAAE